MIELVSTGASDTDLQLVSDGNGEFPDGYRLTAHGYAKVALAVLKEIRVEIEPCWPHGQYESFNEFSLSNKLRELENGWKE